MIDDINKLRKILESKGRYDLSDLLRHSRAELNVSSSYGSKSFSLLSTYDIHVPFKVIGKVEELSKVDKDEIFKAVRQLYPVRDEKPEIYEVNYVPHFEPTSNDLVSTEGLQKIDFSYVQEHLEKCRAKIDSTDFSGAITNARSLIETVCLYINHSITSKPTTNDGNLIKMYKTVADNLNLSPKVSDEEYVKQVLSGLTSIITGLSHMRNELGDAHGTGPSDISKRIDEMRARLAVNLAMTFCEFLWRNFEVWKLKSDINLHS